MSIATDDDLPESPKVKIGDMTLTEAGFKQLAREQWLAERRTGIGGSDAAAAVGLSKWKTRLELFLDKTGRLRTDETEPMRWGTLLEPIVRQEYVNRTGRTVKVPNRILRHPKTHFAIVNVDGIADDCRLYEGKTARSGDEWGEPGTDEVPHEYLLQVQHAMYVTGLRVADIAVLIGGSDFRLYVVPADDELQSLLIEMEAEFWRCVETNTEPEPVGIDDMKLRWRRDNGGKVIADTAIEQAAKQLRKIKDAIKAAEAEESEITALIQGYMQDAAELANPSGQLVATWKNVNAAPRFDMERFKSEQPELWKSFLVEPSPRRQFLLKAKG